MNRLSSEDTQAFALLLGKKLAADLDAGDVSFFKTAVKLLSDLPMEMARIACKEIGIARLVKYELDLDPDFGPLLEILNEWFCQQESIQDDRSEVSG